MLLAILIFGFGLKIDSVKCSTARSCVVHLNKIVAADTKVYVKTKDGKTVPVPIKAGTQDAQFFLPDSSEVYASASLKP